MVGLDSLLASSLARRLDVLMQALDSASPNAVGESASTNVAVAADTPSSTTDGADAQPLNTGAAPPGPPAVLSSAARTIDTLLSLAPDAPGPVTGTEPLWPLPPGDATHALAPVIVAALRQAMDSSGLFYESHLAQWASGGRSLEQLQTEPQTQWPPDTRLPGELPAAAATGAKAVRRRATSALRKRPATWADKRADRTRLPRITSPRRKAGRIACPRSPPK